MNLIEKLTLIFNLKTGYRFWYQVRFTYKDKNNREVFHYYGEVGLVNKHSVLISKNLKKLYPLHKNKGIPKILLNKGGKYYADVVSYLGYFKKNSPATETKNSNSKQPL